MKAIYLIFHGMAAHNGISKKIGYQRDAFRNAGIDIRLCYLTRDQRGHLLRMLDDEVLEDYGFGIGSAISKRIAYRELLQYIRREGVRFIYMRSNHNANPILNRFLREVKELGVKVVMEIPTYPYEQEYTHASLHYRVRLFCDQAYREGMARSLWRIATFSDDETIFGIPTVRLSNGIDFSQIPVKSGLGDTSKQLNLIGVADINFWHGFDRLIAGLAGYYQQENRYPVHFHVVGQGIPRHVNHLKKMVADNRLENHVTFHGPHSGAALDALFEGADMGVGSLARHRSGIDKIKTLKNREYAARGIPFVYSETDDDFEQMPYIIKVPADESPVDIAALVEFYRSHAFPPSEIRATIEGTLSWDVQMKKVADSL